MNTMAIEEPRREDETREDETQEGTSTGSEPRSASERDTSELEGRMSPESRESRGREFDGTAGHGTHGNESGSDRMSRRVLMPGPRMLFHAAAGERQSSGYLSYHDAMKEYQYYFVTEALTRNGWNVALTARQIKIQRSHLYKIMKAHKLVRPKKRPPGCVK